MKPLSNRSRDARRSLRELAGTLYYEEGRRAPSLPELEALVYALKLPIEHFWGKEAMSDDEPPTAEINLPQLMVIRQRMIGAMLRQARESANKSMRQLSQETGIPVSRLKSYELGERPIPLPDLEVLLQAVNRRVEDVFDKSGPIGQWLNEQKAIRNFLKLPPDLQAFVTQPVNIPYLELARKLSDLSSDRLRAVAESLLDITF